MVKCDANHLRKLKVTRKHSMNSKFSFGRVKILADCNVEGLQIDALKYVVPKVRVEFTMHNKTYTLMKHLSFLRHGKYAHTTIVGTGLNMKRRVVMKTQKHF